MGSTKVWLFAAALCSFANLAVAKSHTVTADGICTGQDQVPILSAPWEKSDITIHAVTVSGLVQSLKPLPHGLFQRNPVTLYVFAGNSATPDVMAGPVYGSGLGQATATAPQSLPVGMPLPADLSKHADAHIWCIPKGASFNISETVWYTVDQKQLTSDSR